MSNKHKLDEEKAVKLLKAHIDDCDMDELCGLLEHAFGGTIVSDGADMTLHEDDNYCGGLDKAKL